MEEIVAEWFEYKGYIVKRNERVGQRQKGGYECELDVVGFNPKTKHLVHIETSTDAKSWPVREKRFSKKFDFGTKHMASLFEGLSIPKEIEKKAIFVSGSNKNHKTVGGGQVVLAHDFIIEILKELRETPLSSRAVPEKYPILRVLQMVTEYWAEIAQELDKKRSSNSLYG